MDSQHRHDLKENDLANLLTGASSIWNDKEWWTRYGNKILLVLLLVSAAFLAKTWADNRSAAAHEQQWADLAMANSPESYDAIASSYSDPAIKSLALLRAGDLYAQRAAAGESVISTLANPAATQPSKVTTNPAQDATAAIGRYQQVIDMQDVSPLIRTNALLGLASAYEDKSDWANAAATYEQLAKEAKGVSPVLVIRAKNRLAILPRLKEPVVFAPEPPAANASGPGAGNSSSANSPLPGLGTIPMPAAPKPAAAPSSPASEKDAVPAKDATAADKPAAAE